MGFGFAKKIGKDEYETVMPISPCKDYLNDVIFAEATGKAMSVYGFSYKKTKLFDNEDKYAYMAFKICPYKVGKPYNNQEADVVNLDKNIAKVEQVINALEKQLGLKLFTKIHSAGNSLFLAELPKYWTQYTYLISLWSLAVRMAQFWDGNGSPDSALQSYKNTLDKSLWDGAKNNVMKLIASNGEIPKQDFKKYDNDYSVHNCGIIGFQFK